MTTFIYDVLKDLKSQRLDLSNIVFILPSKRAGLFLKHSLPQVIDGTIFSPIILSVETFIEELSQLKQVSNTELLFEFYTTYCELTKKDELDSFDSFSKWAQILLQDFNEIDRYLIPQKKIFNYLSAIQDLNHWSLDENKTDFVAKYLSFWNKLHDYYTHYTERLIDKKIGYQGLIYRESVENLEAYIQSNSDKFHVFVGFNALNSAEETIIQELLQNDLGKIYWDIDAEFMKNSNHDAGLFARHHKNNWKYFEHNSFDWISNNYTKQKDISVYGIPKNVGQAKCIGSILNDLNLNPDSLNRTAVVLGDENLLIPVLNSLPKSVQSLNITMGFPLKSIPLASLFEHLFTIHKNTSKSFYYKDVIKILKHQFIKPLLFINGIDLASEITKTIQSNNIVYVHLEQLKSLSASFSNVIDVLFNNWGNDVDFALNNCNKLILLIKAHLDKNKTSNKLSLEYLFRFNELFNEITRLNSQFNHIKDISTLHNIYKDLLSSETLDFQGEPLQGLQLMGMLESRVLDFETVIISSVNEGVLPSGKSNNSFIPFDLKKENNLPTYKEKDAVYTYHFYRLLQRAKNIHILYNTEADVITGGEKSRFITQLELEGIHTIKHQIITPNTPVIDVSINSIKKTDRVLKELKQVAKKGFSPSSLTNYIRNPIDFYYQKILKIKEQDEVEESVAANTLGTVVHNTLEDFYSPYVGKFISESAIKDMKAKIEKTVAIHFKKEYKEGDITKGINLIIFEIAKRFVSNFLNLEIQDLKQGNKIKIIAIESHNAISISIPELDFPINLTGKIDRVDDYNGVTRIIDYKTGKVDLNKVEIINWEDITSDYDKFSKSFQVLMYAYIIYKDGKINLPVEAGIFSFKNLNKGFLKFSKKDKPGSYAIKESLITQETLKSFEKELQRLIIEICNPEIDFVEKEVP